MIRDLTLSDALMVCADMREQDKACIRAVCGCEPGEWFAVDRWKTEGPAWCLYQSGEPWAIGGVSLQSRWHGVMWFVARNGFTLKSGGKLLRMTRIVARNALDPSNPSGVHRLEAHVLSGWAEAERFAERVGFRLEGTRHKAGSAGEDVQMWAMTRN